MECPYCSHSQSKVTNKRSSPSGIRRRRECLKCHKRFTTYEQISQSDIYVIKKDTRREIFDHEKLSRGVYKSFEKRPVPKNKIDRAIQEIEELIRKKGKKEIKSEFIGELVMKRIKKLDQVAYIRFASVYKDFQDLEDFKKTMKEI